LYFSIVYHFYLDINTCFDFAPENYLWYYPMNLAISLTGGVIWQESERVILKLLKSRQTMINQEKTPKEPEESNST